MSYSGGSGRSFGNRGSVQRKEKKKKQDFHKHRLKLASEEPQSLDQLKERVSIGLSKLGAQVFSSEPGGYGFQNWMTSFNLLLDDFEEKCGPSTLPKEYYDARLKLTAELLEPVDTSVQDSEIENLEKEISSIEGKISEIAQKSEKVAVEEWHNDEAKISRLRKERSQTEIDIEAAKTDLEEEKKKANKSMFKRIFSSSETLKPLQQKLDSLIERKENIETEIRSLEQDRSNKQSEVKRYDSEISGLRATLEEAKTRLGEAGARKLEAEQIGDRRMKITKSMSEMITSLRLDRQSENSEAEQPSI